MSLHGSMPLRLTVHSLPIGDTDTYLLRDLPLCSFSNARRGRPHYVRVVNLHLGY
jgi:hypothetical protein